MKVFIIQTIHILSIITKGGIFMRVNNRYVSFYYENDNDMGAIEIDPRKQRY